MVYLLTTCCMILAAGVCSISYLVVNKRLQNSDVHSSERDNVDISVSDTSDSTLEVEPEGIKNTSYSLKLFINDVKNGFTINPASRWTVFGVSIFLIGVISFCANTFTWGGSGLDNIGLAKVIITSILMMSAAIVDFYTKKIPNFISILFLLCGTLMLVIEFIFMRESFLILLVGSLLGLIGGFLVLLVMSLITKGGIGMGDVKLISTMGFLSGIAASFYTFFAATVLCLIVTLFLLIFKLKKIKDELPFGPFLFIGYFIVILLGKF